MIARYRMHLCCEAGQRERDLPVIVQCAHFAMVKSIHLSLSIVRRGTRMSVLLSQRTVWPFFVGFGFRMPLCVWIVCSEFKGDSKHEKWKKMERNKCKKNIYEANKSKGGKCTTGKKLNSRQTTSFFVYFCMSMFVVFIFLLLPVDVCVLSISYFFLDSRLFFLCAIIYC